MNRVTSVLTVVFCFTWLFAFSVAPANADEWNRKTIVTFSGPVEIPNKVLPAGTYVFRLMDSPSDRNIVQIFDKDETKLFATILAIPDYRMNPTDKPVITFEERASNAPPAVRAWFYPGDQYGETFVYPKVRAVELAKRTNQNVPSMPSKLAENITKPAKSSNEPHVAAMKQAPVHAITPQGKEVQVAQAVHPKPEAAPKPSLPQTAGELPLIAMLGLLSLATAAALQRISSAR